MNRAIKLRAATVIFDFVALLTFAAPPSSIPSFDEAMRAKRDVWGEAAMAQPNGASYEFFEKLLPPPRYVNADFRYYPIVLSAPNAKVKARLVSNGSGVNLSGGSRSWNDVGTSVRFRVGPDEYLFGTVRDRTSEPVLAEGWLPIVETRYSHRSPVQSGGVVPLDQPKHVHPPEIYRQEAFVATDAAFATNAVVFVKFDLSQGTNGYLAVDVDSKSKLQFHDGRLTDDDGRVLGVFDAAWKWERGLAVTRLKPGTIATLAIPTKPLVAADVRRLISKSEIRNPKSEIAQNLLTSAVTFSYDEQRETCARTWRGILAQGMNVETPEPVVNNAWRHLICQNFELINGDRIHYSAGNQYDALYESEGSDALLAMLVWGYESDARRLIVPLLDFTRKGLEFHQAGFKLNNVSRYFWQTREVAAVKELRARWEKEAQRLATPKRILLRARVPDGWKVVSAFPATDRECST